MFNSSSENTITDGSFNAPQARANVVVNVAERGPVSITRHDETTRRATESSNIRQEVAHSCCLPSHIVYMEHLSTKGRGPALWIPEPDQNLSLEYREEGVSIGDVGIVEPSGSFDFFFNINKPAEHAVNCNRPCDFQPLDPPLQAHDISNIEIFGAGSFLASSSIKRVRGSTNGVLEFESSASEGAIVVMPDATSQSNLKNLDRFYQHIGVHAESWYQYANGPEMGRRLNNGDLCLVIGCDKTTSWGIATFSNSLSASQLQFMRVAGSSGDLGPSYTWEHSGTTDCPRVGPSRRGPFPNQCLFIRYLAFKLSERAWPGLRDPTGVQIRMKSHGSTTSESKQSNTPSLSPSQTFSSALSHVLRLFFSSNPNCKETTALPEPTQESLEIIAVSYAISETPSLSMYLVDYLLQFPGAKVAATPGIEWYSKYTPVDGVADYISNFIKNVLSENEVRLNESGVTYFHPLPSASVTSAEIAANSLTPLGLALVALKSAHDMVSKAGAYKKRCVSLVDRCAQLMINVCSRIEVDSPILPTSDLELLVNTCTAVRDITIKLSDGAPAEDIFNTEEIEQEIWTGETGLMTAFTVFIVNTNAIQNRVQENLLWALEQDRQQFLYYLDSVLKDAESRIDAMPTSPMRDSNEEGGLQTPKPGDNVIYGVLSVDVAVRDGNLALSGDVDHNSDAVSAIQEVKVAPEGPIMENSTPCVSHPLTDSMESLTAVANVSPLVDHNDSETDVCDLDPTRNHITDLVIKKAVNHRTFPRIFRGPVLPLAPPDALPVAREKFAILIGINYGTNMYHDHRLVASHKDVASVMQLLIECYGFEEKNIKVLIDSKDTSPESLPSFKNIMDAIKYFIRPGKPNVDYFLVYSGYSYQEPEDLKKGPIREPEEDGLAEYIVPCDALLNEEDFTVDPEKLIIDYDLHEILVEPIKKLKGCQLIALFDSCHSGSMLNLKHYRCNRVGGIKDHIGRRVGRSLLEVIHSHFSRSSATSSSTASEPETKKVKPCSGFCARIPTLDRPPVICISANKDPQRTLTNDDGSMISAIVDLLRRDRNPTYAEIMYAARDGVTATSAKSKAAIDRKFLEAAASRRRYRSLMPSYFLDAEAREEKRRLEDELTKEWHPDLSSVKPLNIHERLRLA